MPPEDAGQMEKSEDPDQIATEGAYVLMKEHMRSSLILICTVCKLTCPSTCVLRILIVPYFAIASCF